jgi:DNA-binding beta-propeller fold protein YncE
VADSGNHRLQKLSPTGQPLAQWGRYGSAVGEFSYPYAVALDAQGSLYVLEQDNNRLQKLSGVAG